LYRLKGELLLKDEGGRPVLSEVEGMKDEAEDEAEKCFWQALEVARRQEARSLELRAVMSLSRLWQSQGRQAQAKQILGEIYGWFTEGFETADLKEAKVLLERL
jgi:adenylate cyclase